MKTDDGKEYFLYFDLYPTNLIFTTLIRFFNYTIPKHL